LELQIFDIINEKITKSQGDKKMIKIVAKNIVKDENLETFKAQAEVLVKASRSETGCIEYGLHEDINNPNTLTFIECWKDQEAINIHNNSEHFKTIVPKLGELRDGSEINLYREV